MAVGRDVVDARRPLDRLGGRVARHLLKSRSIGGSGGAQLCDSYRRKVRLIQLDWGVMRRRRGGLPPELARRPVRTLRPGDAGEVYAHPRAQVQRLTEQGYLHRVSHGHYVVVPTEAVGTHWRPSLEAVAVGIATTDVGTGDVVLMGPSAARVLGAIPRALATGVVAVPTRHRPVRLSDRDAVISFVTRDTARLDAISTTTDLGRALVTSVEQTALDMARRPTLGGLTEAEARDAVRDLVHRADPAILERLAVEQNLRGALARARGWAEDIP